MKNRVSGKTGKFCAALVLLVALCGCAHSRPQAALPVIAVDHGPNGAAQQSKPYVVLVSLDGFRYDYPQKYGAPHLQAMAARGASAPDGMIPVYPSVTFVNHYSIVTGLYSEHHGIVANNFYDPERKQRYSYGKQDAAADGTWYGGVPLWSLAESQGMRSACFFWPGSEAEIAGQRPSFYLHFDNKIPDEERIDQVIRWLQLPAESRPHFITLYYFEPDHSGHQFGPDSPQVADAVHHVDDLMGDLEAKLDNLHLPIDLVVVADHGMENIQSGWINLDKWANLSNFETDGPLMYPKSEADAQEAYAKLHGASDQFEVYRRRDVPARLHYDSNPRSGDPVVVLNGPYWLRARSGSIPGEPSPELKGAHGFDPTRMKSMRAIFYAVGPDIRRGATLPPFENINIYPFIAKILGLEIGSVDGDGKILEGILQSVPQHAGVQAGRYSSSF